MWLTGSAWEGDVGSSLYPSFVYNFIAAVLAYITSRQLLDMPAANAHTQASSNKLTFMTVSMIASNWFFFATSFSRVIRKAPRPLLCIPGTICTS